MAITISYAEEERRRRRQQYFDELERQRQNNAAAQAMRPAASSAPDTMTVNGGRISVPTTMPQEQEQVQGIPINGGNAVVNPYVSQDPRQGYFNELKRQKEQTEYRADNHSDVEYLRKAMEEEGGVYQQYLDYFTKNPMRGVYIDRPTELPHLSEEQKKKREEQQAIKNGMTPDQALQFSQNKVAELPEAAQKELTHIIAMQEDYDTQARYGGYMNDPASLQRREDTKKAIDEAEAKFKKDYKLSDEVYARYKDYRQRITNAEYNQNQRAEIERDISTGSKARQAANIGLYTVGSVLNYPLRGAEALVDIAAQRRNPQSELGVDIYSDGFQQTNMTRNIREAAAQRIGQTRLGETGSNLYQTGASIADSIYGGVLAGAVVPQVNVGNKVANWFANKGVQALGMAPTIGASAAATAYQDARNRGLDEKSAEATALASGLIEIGTESVSLDNLFDVAKGNSRLLRKPLIQMLASAGIEGSEEWASEGLNAFADWLINDGQSEYEQAVEQYKANGMTDKEARNRAKLDVLHDANEAFKWGAVSGILPGAGATAIGTAVSTKQARNLDRNMDYEALGRAISTDESQYTNKSALRSAETAKQQAEDFARRKERGEKISNRELRDLYWNIQDAATTETESRGENNESPNPSIRVYDAIPDIITNKMENDKINSYNAPDTELTAEDVTRRMAQAVTADQLVSLRKQAETSENEEVRQAAQNAFEINQGRIMSNYEDQGHAEFEAAEAMPTKREAFNAGLNGEMLAENASTEAQIAYREGRVLKINRDSRTNISEDFKGMEVSPEDQSKLTGQIKMEGKQLQAVTDNGTVAIDKIADPAVRALYQNAAEQGTKEAAQVYLDNYASNMPIGRYTNAFDRYSVAGATNTMQFEEMYKKDTLLHKWMSKDQLQKIYDFGAREAAQQKLDNAARQNRAIAVMGTGKVIDNTRAGIGDSLMHMVQAMAKATGKDYVITDKAAQNINGYFNRSMQMVVLNAKNSDDLLNTLFHEGFGEVLKAHNAEGYDKVQQSIMDYLAENPTGFTRAIKNYQGAYTDVEGEKSLYDAASEMINDSIAGLFSTEEGIHDFSEWADKKFKPEEKKTLFQNIADYFAKLVDSFKEMLGRSRLSDSARQAAKMGEKRAAEIRQMILNEMDIATENAAGLQLDESLRSEDDNAYSLQQTETIDRIREDLGEDAEIQTAEDGTFQIATNNDTAVVNVSDINYSLKTLDNTQKKLAQVLKDKGHTQEEIDYALDMIQRQAELLQDVASGYMEMGEALQADIITDIKGGKQVIRSLVKNGEYPVNVDFMTICKKRQAYMKVLTDLIDDGTFSAVSFAPDAIVDVNNILRMNGYETACLGCFVESRRLQIQKWSESFVDAWNRKVRDVLGDQEPKPFNFGRNERGTTSLSDEEIRQLHEEFQNAGKKNVKGNINLGKGTVEQKMERLLEKMPTMARTLEVGDILKPNGVDNLRNHYGDLYSLLLQWYGSNTPKVNQDFNPYNGEFNALNFSFMKVDTGKNLPRSEYYKKWAKNQILSENGQKYEATKQEIEDRALQKYLYDIGGARLQSFSDFLIENSLDYFQMIGDLAARRFPMHAYSKEISFARMFGMTGMKENMSLIPVVNRAAGKDMAGLNPDGSYAGWGDFERHIKMKGQSFIQSIGWKDAIALQLDPRYSKNVGTIAIGISDAHIRKMLNDPLIRMVIPYHSSGMNPQFAKAMNIDFYTDYTDFQNTTVKQYYDLDGNPVDKLEGKLKVDLEYNFNEAAQRLGDARAAAQEYIEWCAKEHPVYVGKKKVGTAVFTPKFESFTTGEGSENYYKLLEDFNMYDAITEEAAPQGAVKMMYPDAQHMLTEQQLNDYEQRLRDTGEFTEKDIQKYVKKAQQSLEDIIRQEAQSRNEYHRTQDAKYDETYKAIKNKLQDYKRNTDDQDVSRAMESGDDLRYSVKVTDPDTIRTLENQDHITTYRSFQVIDGGLYAPMAAMDYEVDDKGHKKGKKLGYRSELGQWEQATEAIDVARTNFANGKKAKDKNTGIEYAKFDLEGGDNQTGGVAYNPYLHSSNVVLNDQFAAAYRRNLVVVECEVPASELTSGYRAELAKDPTGWREWKSGAVAGEIAKQKPGFERQVFLSRWMKPVRILDDSEVASMYKEYLEGTDGIKVPWNVVTPSLRNELEKQGVPIDYGDRKFGSSTKSFKEAFPNEDVRYSVKVDSQGRDLSEGQQEYFKDSKIRDNNGALKVMYHGTQNDFTVFDFSQGGKNGTAEGFGIYLTDNPEVSQSYGSRIIEGYANITKPAYSDRRTIKKSELAKLINETVTAEAKQLAEDYDGDLKAAEKDTWISNYVDTYNQSMKSAINEAVDSIMQMNDNDMDIIQEVMTGMAIRDYPDAVEFYDMLTRVTGIDGFLTNWTSRDNGSKSLIALAFRSNQIKNVDNQNPTDNQDIRYSLSNDFVDFTSMDIFAPDEDTSFAEEETASILEEGAAVLKDVPIDKNVISKIARKMTKFYGSSYSSQSLADNLEKIFAYAKDSDLSNARDLARVVKEVAMPVIEAAENKTGGEDLQAAKQALSGFKLDLTDRQRQEVMHAFGSYVNYKREMKKLGVTISANGSSMDSMWTSIADALPGTLPEDTVEGDMPIVLYDQLVGLGSRVQNGFGMDNDEAAQDLALKIMSEYYTEMGKQEGIKKADQAKLKAQAQRSKEVMDKYRTRIKNQYDKRYQKELEKLQERYDENTAKKMASLEAASKRKAERSRDAALAREEKDKIRKNAGKLMDMLQHPTKTKHVPAVLQDTVIDLVSAIDFVAPKITRLPDGRFQTKILVPGVNGQRSYETYTGDSYMEVMNKYQEALANGQGTKAQKTWQAKLSAVRQLYKDSEAAVASGDAVSDYQNLLKSDLGDALERVITENNGRPSLQSLSSEDLKVVNKVVRNIYTAINNIDKSYSMPEQVSEIGNSVIKRGASMKSQKDRLNASKLISRFMKLDNATPETFFHGMGEAGDKIYKALFEAQNQKARFEREDREFMDTIFKRVPIQTIQSWTSDKSPIVYEDGDFKLRVDQIMTLYEINKRQSTQAHQYEGFKAGTIKINGKEHIDENPHILTKAKISEITSHLTEDQKWVADQLQQYMATVGSKRGNDQTLKIYGYEMFTEPDYFPAQVDKTTVQTNAQNSATEGNINGILNAGFTKEIQPNAKNPLILNSIFDVYLDHMNQVNTYASHAGVLSDINRINNYKEKENIKVDDQTFGRQHTVKQALDSIYGSDGKEYLVQFLKDVNQQEMATKTGAGVLAILTKNFKSAATLGNLRVVAQQPTAWCRALAVMDPKYMAAGLVGNKDAAKLQEETSMISWIKDNGNIDGLTTQSQRAQVLGLQTRKEKINELTGWLAGKADSVTWAALYRAVYAEQKDKFKGKTDSDEFKKAVNDRFDEVIARTQVVDGTLMRSQMMRSTDRLNMNFSAFMAEPTKTYNMFLRQFNDMIYEKRITGKIPRKAWEMMSRIIAAHVITQFVNAIPQSVMDAARDEEEGSTFWEKFLAHFGINVDDDASTLEKAFTAVEGNFLSNLGVIDKIPVLSTINDNYVWPWIKKLVWGESTYTSSTDNEFQALNAIDLALKGTAFKSDKSKLTKYGSAARVANAISMVTGIPAYGLIRDTVAIYNSLNDLWGGDNIRRNEATSAERAKPVLDVIKAGGDYKAAIEKAVSKGAEYSKIETQITDAYKQQYIDLMAAGNTSEASKLENRLLAMFEYLNKKEGQKSSNKKRVRNWYESWLKKQEENQ